MVNIILKNWIYVLFLLLNIPGARSGHKQTTGGILTVLFLQFPIILTIFSRLSCSELLCHHLTSYSHTTTSHMYMLSRDSHQQLITTPIGWTDSRREWERSTNSQDTEESGCSKKENSVWGEWIIAFKGLVLCIFSNDWIKPSIRCYFSRWIKNTVLFSRYRITTSLQEKQVKQKKVQLTYQFSHWLPV